MSFWWRKETFFRLSSETGMKWLFSVLSAAHAPPFSSFLLDHSSPPPSSPRRCHSQLSSSERRGWGEGGVQTPGRVSQRSPGERGGVSSLSGSLSNSHLVLTCYWVLIRHGGGNTMISKEKHPRGAGRKFISETWWRWGCWWRVWNVHVTSLRNNVVEVLSCLSFGEKTLESHFHKAWIWLLCAADGTLTTKTFLHFISYKRLLYFDLGETSVRSVCVKERKAERKEGMETESGGEITRRERNERGGRQECETNARKDREVKREKGRLLETH